MSEHMDQAEQEALAQNSPQDVRRMVTIEVGQRLRLARDEQQLSLASISDHIKLSVKQLQALEAGDWQQLPNDRLALAFLRQYAQYLAIDIEATVQRLKSDALGFHQAATFPDPAIAPNRNWAKAAAALFVLLLLVWNFMGSEDTPSEISPLVMDQHPAEETRHVQSEVASKRPSVVESVDPVALQPQPTAAVKVSPVEVVPVKVAPVKAMAKKTTATSTSSSPAIAATTHQPVEEPANVVPAANNETVKVSSEPVMAAGGSEPAAKGALMVHEFSFQAGDDRVWLLVEIPDGSGGRKRFREVILRPHHSLEVKREDPHLFISVGNAGGLKVLYDGKMLYDFGQLGKRGMVVRHLQLQMASTTTMPESATAAESPL